jgi:hypothetical protein
VLPRALTPLLEIEALNTGAKALPIQCNVLDEKSVQAMVDATLSTSPTLLLG